MDPYEAPKSNPSTMDEQVDDIAAITPTMKARATTMLVLATALVTLLVGVQELAGVTFYDKILLAIPFTQVVIGVVLGVAGFWLNKLRKKGALTAAGVCAFSAVGNTALFFLAADRGFFSLLQLAVIPLSVVAGAFAVTMLRRCEIADEARERMKESGLDTAF